MAELPYKVKCKKCSVEFMAFSTHCRRCVECAKIDHSILFYPKVFYKNRKIIFDRDEYKCQCCGCQPDGQNTNKLVCHHIDCDRQNNSPSNLITLCIQCHHSLHNKYTKYVLRRSNIYKLFSTDIRFGEFGKNLIYGAAKVIVKKQFSGKPKLFFGVKKLLVKKTKC